MAAGANQESSTEFTIDNVSADALSRARTALTHLGMSGIDGETGSAVGREGRVDYHYDPSTEMLTCEVVEVPGNLRDLPDQHAVQAVRKIIQGALATAPHDDPPGAGLLGDKAGVYCYVIPTLTNKTGLDLAYATSSFTHGSLYEYTGTIEAGKESKIFEAHSGAASGLGIDGSVTYQLADGTPLTFTFNLLSTCDYSFTAGFTGQNAGRYATPEVTDKEAYLKGYTYLKPKITIRSK